MSTQILRTQRGLARRAQAQPEHKFGDVYPLICREAWLAHALKRVLSNRGARSAGVDGISAQALKTDAQQAAFLTALRQELKDGTYRPSPVKRVWIPKPGKAQKRPLGIPTLKDRVVQEVVRMVLEPIWESDFLNCSYGFRPGRRTMDAIGECYRRITGSTKYFWIIEGDIRSCFDRIPHQKLLTLMWQRVADHRLMGLVKAFLQAGVLEGRVVQHTGAGTPQGGILSPLLANIYLHELDKWWWERYGKLTPYQRRTRRERKQGNAILLRYADDWIVLWNGTHEGALALRDELAQFLRDELQLELAAEKTHVTHVSDGFDFLGFHLKRHTPHDGKAWLRVTPAQSSIRRFKARVKALTSQSAVLSPEDLRFKQLNWLIRGWGNYYRHVNFKVDAGNLDWWINRRVLIWLRHKHPKRGTRWMLARYKVREERKQYNRWNFGVATDRGGTLCVAKLADIPIQPYRVRRIPHPYLGEQRNGTPDPDDPFPNPPSPPNIDLEQTAWREKRREVLKRDGYQCTRCGKRDVSLDAHHQIARRDGGTDELDNLTTLCRTCHQETPSYGKPPVAS